MSKIGVLLHGNGVYDGTEIHEAVLTLLAIREAGHSYVCLAPNVEQHHVIDHIKGEEMEETRNVLIESARIARGEIDALTVEHANTIDALVMPGGFGTAKNITKWAFSGPEGAIDPLVRDFLLAVVKSKKPIVALCMSPTTLAKALEGSGIKATLSVGSTEEVSPYEIEAISAGVDSVGMSTEMKTVREVSVDDANKIICAPCYMMDADILDVHKNIRQAIEAMNKWL
ncbi:MAG: isoprenoid biosynthesis glyoxalase ElbB [Cryomorphaceae bacterium]|nr:isoprenoid biosynthesis glyoxalase ElbB [Cryomorphaceae bacterium]